MDERWTSAREKLQAGDAMGAFQDLRPLVSFPAELDDVRFVEAFGLFAQIARAIAGDELGDAIAAAASAPSDPQHLYDAAYALYEQQLFPIAATLLSRANELVPGNRDIVVELSANLEAMLEYGPAAAMLEASGLPGRDAVCTYLHGLQRPDVRRRRDRTPARR